MLLRRYALLLLCVDVQTLLHVLLLLVLPVLHHVLLVVQLLLLLVQQFLQVFMFTVNKHQSLLILRHQLLTI